MDTLWLTEAHTSFIFPSFLPSVFLLQLLLDPIQDTALHLVIWLVTVSDFVIDDLETIEVY